MNCYTGSSKRGPPYFISIFRMCNLTLGFGFYGRNWRVAIESVYLIKYNIFLSYIWERGLWMNKVWWLRWDIKFKSDFGSLITSSAFNCFWDWTGGMFGSVFDLDISAVIFLYLTIYAGFYFSYSFLAYYSTAGLSYSSFFSPSSFWMIYWDP